MQRIVKEMGTLKKHLGLIYDWKKDEQGQTMVEVTMSDLIKEIIEVAENHF